MTIPSVELNQIITALREEDKPTAIKTLRQVLKHNPSNIRALIWLGGLTTHPREGIIALERALNLDPDNKLAQQYLERWRLLQVGVKRVEDETHKNLEGLVQRKSHRLAMLIDGDNARPILIDKVMLEAQKYGSLQIKRIYGDWTRSGMQSWKRVLHRHALQPIQQYQYTIGKNSTDSALIIDAMDILYADMVDGFCLVSSDSDYTRLATRIAENGLFVMGIGKRGTPNAFINACDLFIHTDTLLSERELSKRSKRSTKRSSNKGGGKSAQPDKGADAALMDGLTQEEKGLVLLKRAYLESVQEDGRAYLGTMGNYLQKYEPDFQPRKYGFRQLSQMIKAQNGHFETEMVDSKIYVRLHNGRRGNQKK